MGGRTFLLGKAGAKTKVVLRLRAGGGADGHFNRSFYFCPCSLFSTEQLVVS